MQGQINATAVVNQPREAVGNFIPNTEIEKLVCSYTAEILNIDAASITMEQSFYELGGTSIDLYDLIIKFEDKFDVEIDQGALQQYKRFDEMADYLEDVIGGENA